MHKPHQKLKTLRATFLVSLLASLFTLGAVAAEGALTTYVYLKPNQQTAVLGYLSQHNLQEGDVVPFYYKTYYPNGKRYHDPHYVFANTYMPGRDGPNVNQGQGYLIDGEYWKSTEHYYQASKFPGNKAYRQVIKNADSGGKAAKLGQANKPGKDHQWNSHKKQIMYHALQEKFSQDTHAQNILLNTGDKILIEAAAGSTNFRPDFTWGIGDDGSGQNWLGELLMKVRGEQ